MIPQVRRVVKIMIEFPITPIPKPRLTRQGRFSKVAKRYYAYCRDLQTCVTAMQVTPGETLSLRFILPMPKSWSQRKRREMDGQPHQQTPDLDNLLKAWKDALYVNDAHVWAYREVEKRWGHTGKIQVLN